MRVGKRINKPSDLVENGVYLVVNVPLAIGYEQPEPTPSILGYATLMSTYLKPGRTWGENENFFIYELDYKYNGNRQRQSLILVGVYEILKTFYADIPSVQVLWGHEYNTYELSPDEHVDDNCIVVCDNADPHYHEEKFFHIDGAFSISAYKKHLTYEWWPYPEEPIQGRTNILNHIIKHHLPDEHKQAAQTAFGKIQEQPQPQQSKQVRRITSTKTSTKGAKRKQTGLSPEDKDRLAKFGKFLGFGRRLKKEEPGEGASEGGTQ